MENNIMTTDWINHYIKKLCEIDEVLESGNTTLIGIKETLNEEFCSKTTISASEKLQTTINSTNNSREDISEAINMLRSIIVELA